MCNTKNIVVFLVLFCLFLFHASAQDTINSKEELQINNKSRQISIPYNFIYTPLRIDTVYNPEQYHSKLSDKETVILNTDYYNLELYHSKPATKRMKYLELKKTRNEEFKKNLHTTRVSPSLKQISGFGWGFFASFRQQWYDNIVMNYFKKVPLFSMDLDLAYNKWMFTGNAAFGGGYLYDSLYLLDFNWQPQTKITTTTYSMTIGYSVKDARYVKITPFSGFQLIELRFKPKDFMLVPVGLDNEFTSPWSFSIGIHAEVKDNRLTYNEKFFSGWGGRISYSYTILNFTGMKGYMHQVTIGGGFFYRKVKKMKI